MTFNPKKSLYILLTVVFLIGIGVPYLIFLQEGGDPKYLAVGQWIKIFFPSFFLIGGIRLMFLIKRIQIENGIWTVTTLITGRKLVFAKEDVAEVKVFTSTSYKYKFETRNVHINLKNKIQLKFSSNQLEEFDLLVRQTKKLNK